MLRGTDISAYQDSTVPAGDFVIIKATQGTGYVNSKLGAQLADARKKRMLVGVYHFPEFGNDPLADAAHFCDVVTPLLQPGDIVVLDHEADPPPSAAHAAAWGLKFLPYTEKRCNRRPWVYSNVSWATGGYCAGMGAYPYWCADPSSSIGHPRVRGPFKTWVAHQYSDVGGIDHDVFNGSAADWRALGQATRPTPQEEDEMKQRELKPGLSEQTGLIIADRAHTTFEAFTDNTYTDGSQIKPFAPVKIRVAVEKSDGHWQTEDLTVGRGPKDTKQPRNKFALADKNSVAISVTRESGDGTEPIVIAVY